jgi:pimeloyl-ACP methyl ester carboxylesterase
VTPDDPDDPFRAAFGPGDELTIEAPEANADAEPQAMVVALETGDRVHYLDWTAGDSPGAGPPLLLLHGIAQTAWSWSAVARRLARSARVVAPDMRGHGLSDAARAGYDLESLAWDALTVAAANRWGEAVNGPRIVVAGHGFGGLVAATMAVLQPGSIAGVLLLDAGFENVPQATGLSPAEFAAGLAEPPEVLASLSAFLEDRREFDVDSWDADQERAARSQVDVKHAGHVALVSRAAAIKGVVDAMFAYDPIGTLAQVTQPLTIVIAESGAADDETTRERSLAIEDVARARRAAGQPRERIVRVIGAGHNLMRYRPRTVAAEIERLLNDRGYQRL